MGGTAPFIDHEQIANLILLAVSSGSLNSLTLNLRPVELKRGVILYHAGNKIKRIYLINRGLVSIVKVMEDGRMIEVNAIGIEGMTTPEVLFGANAAILDGMVQIPGSAFVIERSLLADVMANDRSLSNLLQDYLHLSMERLAQTA